MKLVNFEDWAEKHKIHPRLVAELIRTHKLPFVDVGFGSEAKIDTDQLTKEQLAYAKERNMHFNPNSVEGYVIHHMGEVWIIPDLESYQKLEAWNSIHTVNFAINVVETTKMIPRGKRVRLTVDILE